MMMTTDAVDVVVHHKLTQNFPKNDLFIEIDDLQGNPVSAFSDSRAASRWLESNGFRYVEGTSGVWTRKRKGGVLVVPRFDAKPLPRRRRELVSGKVVAAAWILVGLSGIALILWAG